MNPKYKPYRNKQILDFAKGQDCQLCGRNDGTTVSAHANGLFFGKGMGKKSDDCYIAYLCSVCHYHYDHKTPEFAKLKISQEDFNFAMFKTWKLILENFELKRMLNNSESK